MSKPEVPTTLYALLESRANERPNTAAFVHGDNAITFAELHESAGRLAAGLATEGIGRGSRIALWLPNRPDWLIWLFAAARTGALIVAVNTRFRSAEIGDILERTRADILVYEPGFKGIDFACILADVPEAAKNGLKRLFALEDTTQLYLEQATEISGKPDDPVVLFTTSGTTSKPKFVLHAQSSIAIHANEVAAAFGYDETDTVLLQALPLCGTFGLAQALAGIAAGATTILMPAFDGAEASHLIAEHKVTTFNGADQMFQMLLEHASRNDLASLQWCGFAAFATADPVAFVTTCESRGLCMTGLYGMSEVQALFARQDPHAAIDERALGGGNLTSPYAEAEVRNPETDEVLKPGQSGELHLKGPSQFREYLDNPGATIATIGEDGFVKTGDLGYLREDGSFVFEARMGDSLRLGGFLVNPAEIDSWIIRFAGIAASETVAIQTEKGPRVVSFVLSDGEVNGNAIIAHCNDGLAGYKVPIAIHQIGAYPTTPGPNGEKIQRVKLRELAQARYDKN